MPAFGQYPSPSGLTACAAIFSSTALVFAGGGTSGLPSEKSQTASAPCCFLSSMPFSNILRIHDEPAMDCRI